MTTPSSNVGADASREWQPIETVPMDGTDVLIGRFAPGTQWDGRMEVDRVNRERGFGTFNQWFPPTHWMPLPTPPAGETK